jgi:hypothetical protein
VQLLVTGKCGKVRQVLLPDVVSRSLLALRGDAGANYPVFVGQNGGRLSERSVNDMVKRAVKAANSSVTAVAGPHPTVRVRLTAAPACLRFSRRSATATSRRRAGICTQGRTARACCA